MSALRGSGIGYFPYSQLFDPGSTCTGDTLYEIGLDFPIHTSPPPSEKANQIMYNGLVDWNFSTQRYDPNVRWHAARDAHTFIDALWPTLDTLTWQGADEWNDLSAISGCNITSIQGVTRPTDSVYLQVARFTSSGGDEYYMFLNRRSLSSDSQDVVIRFDGRPGCTRFYDVYADTSYDVYDSASVVKFTAHFAPAELRLFRVETISDFSGTWAGEWPLHSTINVVGDVTVPAGSALTIRTTNLDLPANADATGGGASSTKTEIIVQGTLRVEGSATNRVVLDAGSASNDTWYGIRTVDSGRVYLDNAIAKHACVGVWGASAKPDTIKNCRFEACEIAGVLTACQDGLIANDTFLNMGYFGLYLNAEGTDITDCYFEDVDQPMYCSGYQGTISGCDFREFDVSSYYPGGSPAIYIADPGSGTEISSCTFNNTNRGIQLGAGYATYPVLIEGCEFFSDSSDEGVQNPFMFAGIYDDGGTVASAAVHHCCFRDIDYASIYRDGATLGIDTAGGNGYNSSTVDSIPGQGGSYYRWPLYHVVNAGTGTLYARGNFYYPASSARFLGTVTWNYLSSATDLCFSTPGGSKAIAYGEGSDQLATPTTFAVRQNYPNPFNPNTAISFDLPAPAHVRVEILNILGQHVATLVDRPFSAGSHTVEWTGMDTHSARVTSGIYLYRVVAGDQVQTNKMLLVK